MSRWGRKARPPPGFDYLEPTLAALEAELRESTYINLLCYRRHAHVIIFLMLFDRYRPQSEVNEGHEGKRKNESLWPVHQINWQRSRYIFDMFYRYEKISREVYEYCVQMVRRNLIFMP
jgi:bud site selection protein 31